MILIASTNLYKQQMRTIYLTETIETYNNSTNELNIKATIPVFGELNIFKIKCQRRI